MGSPQTLLWWQLSLGADRNRQLPVYQVLHGWLPEQKRVGRHHLRAEDVSKFAGCELGISCTYLAKHLELSQPGVGYAVSRGEKIVKKNKYNLLE